jgi:DNA-binding transcriptional ArsR family regulator
MNVVQSRVEMLETQPVNDARAAEAVAAPAPGEPERGALELPAVLHALSDPVRLQIVTRLSDGSEHSCGSLDLPVTKSTCTHHFRVLREAGVIRQRQEGTSRLNSLRSEDLEARFPGLLVTVLRAAREA